jgi:tetratricopeptide (TPR) repeat protein
MNVGPKIAKTILALALAAAASACALAAPAVPDDPPAAAQKKKKVANEKNPQYQCEMGAIALRYGLPDEAIRYGKAAVSLDPGHFDGWNLLGMAHYSKGEFAQAAEALGNAAAIRPDAAPTQRNLGMALAEINETEKAEAALKKAFELDGDAEAAFYLGKLCYNGERYEEALGYALESIRKDGRSAKAYNLKGVSLNQLSRFAEAAGSFQAGLILAPEDVGIRVNLGIAYLNSGETAKALAVFEEVLPRIEQGALRTQVENYIKTIKDAGK